VSYVSLVWILLFLVRVLWRAVQSRRGKPSPPPAGPSRFGLLNLVLVVVYVAAVVPFFEVPAVTVASSDLPPWALWTAVPLLAVGAAYGAFALPHWLAWRILGPWRITAPGRVLLALGVFPSAGARQGAGQLYDARFGRDWDDRTTAASLWTIGGAAVQAEAAGEVERAEALLAALRRLPPKVRLPRRVRAVVGEALAAAAARRGDWQRARARAVWGRGRGVWFLRRAALVHLGRPAAPWILAALWLLAPGRIGNWPLWRATLAKLADRRTRMPSVEQAAARPDPAVLGPHHAHLQLLARAADGRGVRVDEVETLAATWVTALSEAEGAELARRGLELGGLEVGDLRDALSRAIRDDLEALAEVAEGIWSAALDGPLGELRRRRLDRAYAAVDDEIAAFDRAGAGRESRDMDYPLAELERWLAFRERVETLLRIGGEEALVTAWHNGLRTTVCNWPVFLVRRRGADAAWVACFMHPWSAELAERVGDMDIHKLSSENARITRARVG
jgi:hypothetical protein